MNKTQQYIYNIRKDVMDNLTTQEDRVYNYTIKFYELKQINLPRSDRKILQAKDYDFVRKIQDKEKPKKKSLLFRLRSRGLI